MIHQYLRTPYRNTGRLYYPPYDHITLLVFILRLQLIYSASLSPKGR